MFEVLRGGRGKGGSSFFLFSKCVCFEEDPFAASLSIAKKDIWDGCSGGGGGGSSIGGCFYFSAVRVLELVR